MWEDACHMPLIAPCVRELTEQASALKAADNPLFPSKAQASLCQLHKGSSGGKSKRERSSKSERKSLQ